MKQQLALDLSLKTAFSFDNFIEAENAMLTTLLRNASVCHGEVQLYVWGETGCGKTHLLQAVCHSATQQGFKPAYVSLATAINMDTAVLDGLEQLDVVCIDDVELLEDRLPWQHALFDLINRLREQQRYLVLASRRPPNELKLQLGDLQSRLNWGPVIRVHSLDDTGKIEALQLRASSRGFSLPENVANFMLTTYARDLPGLLTRLDKLERASLEQQRKLTIPFIKDVFGDIDSTP